MRTSDAIDIFLKYKRARGLASESIRWYQNILELFAQHCPNLPEEPEDIYNFLAQCKAGDERRHGYYRALHAFYNYLDRRLKAFPNPMGLVDPPRRSQKQPRPITPEALHQLLIYPHRADVKAALFFLADTGARPGELWGLQLDDISKTPLGYIAKITGKTGTRIVPISAVTYHLLEGVLPFRYSKWRLRRLISIAFDNAKISGSAINLRHTFGTFWAGDELVLQQIMGHAHLSTTRIYRQIRIGTMVEQHYKYSPLKLAMGSTTPMEM